MRHDDHILEGRVEQIVPGLRIFHVVLLKPFAVDREAEDGQIEGRPVFAGHVFGRDILDAVGGVGQEQALLFSGDEALGTAAEDDADLGIVLFGDQTGNHFAGGQADVIDVNTGGLFKGAEIGGQFVFGQSGVHAQFLGLRKLAHAREREHQRKKECDEFLHGITSYK